MIVTVTLNPAYDHLLLLSKLIPGRMNRAGSTRRMPGGKGINVASAMSVFGEEVVATGFLGGLTCRKFEEELRRRGVSTSFIYTDQELRTDFYVVEEGKSQQTMLIEDGSPIERRYVNSFLGNFDRLLTVADVVEIGGSLPSGIEPKFVRELVLKARAKGKKVVLDLLEPILNECLDVPGLYIVKPDVREKKILFGKELGDKAVRMGVVKDLKSKGAEVVILNYKKLNYLVAVGGEFYEGGIKAEEHGLLIGVQDGMLAGFIHNYLKSGNAAESFKYALASGLATERSALNYPTSMSEVEKLLSSCEVRRVG